MTESGIRVPREKDHFLTPRKFYEHKDAAFIAYQGDIHLAELFETRNPTVMSLMNANAGHPITDKNLDLDGHPLAAHGESQPRGNSGWAHGGRHCLCRRRHRRDHCRTRTENASNAGAGNNSREPCEASGEADRSGDETRTERRWCNSQRVLLVEEWEKSDHCAKSREGRFVVAEGSLTIQRRASSRRKPISFRRRLHCTSLATTT